MTRTPPPTIENLDAAVDVAVGILRWVHEQREAGVGTISEATLDAEHGLMDDDPDVRDAILLIKDVAGAIG